MNIHLLVERLMLIFAYHIVEQLSLSGDDLCDLPKRRCCTLHFFDKECLLLNGIRMVEGGLEHFQISASLSRLISTLRIGMLSDGLLDLRRRLGVLRRDVDVLDESDRGVHRGGHLRDHEGHRVDLLDRELSCHHLHERALAVVASVVLNS